MYMYICVYKMTTFIAQSLWPPCICMYICIYKMTTFIKVELLNSFIHTLYTLILNESMLGFPKRCGIECLFITMSNKVTLLLDKCLQVNREYLILWHGSNVKYVHCLLSTPPPTTHPQHVHLNFRSHGK